MTTENLNFYDKQLVQSLLNQHKKGIITEKELHETLISYIIRKRAQRRG
jgi:hypothetical protein